MTIQVVTEALERIMEGRTILVIAHRLSTVRNAHEILVRAAMTRAGRILSQVMRDGRVVERGSHRQLLQLGGVYRRLVSKQLEGAADD